MYAYDDGPDSIEPSDVANTIKLVKQEVAYFISLPSPFGNTPATTNSLSTSSPKTNLPTSITPKFNTTHTPNGGKFHQIPIYLF